MKCSDSGDFCILYLEAEDDKATVFKVIGEQKKPVVLMLPVSPVLPAPTATQTKPRVFQRPEDFSDLKHIKRWHNLTIIFVITGNEHLRQLATRNGFPAYASIDALGEALEEGRLSLSHQRTMTKNAKTAPLVPPASFSMSSVPFASSSPHASPARSTSARKTVPLAPPASQWSYMTQAPASPPNSTAAPHTSSPAYGTSSPPAGHARPPAVKQRRRGSRALLIVLIVLSLLALGGAGPGYFLFFEHTSASNAVAPVSGNIVGRLYFLSSEQVSESSNQGLDDQVQLDLHDLQPPAPGNSDYAWLLSDKVQGDTTVLLLGKLSINQGSAHLFYGGDQQHTNLLAITSRFLITEESAATTPIAPSPDYSTWRYYGIIPQSPDSQDPNHFSLLDHLRHLLAADPLLDQLELPGGLCNWFYRNTGKLIEWTVSARDRWEEAKDFAFARRQTVRTLAYLDGLSFLEQDLPAGTSVPYIPNLASVGLTDVHGSNQTPPSYLTHIERHLNGLINAPGATPEIRKEATQIIDAMSHVRQWLQKLHDDAKQLLSMTDAQIAQPPAFALLNDMVDQANFAYTGEVDPTRGTMRNGVIWIHAHVQSLASLDVVQYIQRSQSPEIVPSMQPFTTTQSWFSF